MAESVLATQARIELDRTEAVIGGEGALKREEAVGWGRLVAVIAWATAMTTVDLLRGAPVDRYRPVLGTLYLLWAISTLRGVKRAIREPRTSSWVRANLVWAVVLPVVDTVMITALLLAPTGNLEYLPALYPERAAASFALLVVFSIAKPDWRYVALTGALAAAGYLVCLWGPLVLYGKAPLDSATEVMASMVYILVGYVVIGVLVARALKLMREDFRGVRRLSNLKRFLPAQIAERVYQGGESSLAPVNREATVMFTDIRDFTSQSEKMTPAEVLQLLDFYFGHMSQIVKGHDGVVGKFIGDGMLAFWGVPQVNERHAEGAIKAALDMRKKLEEINRDRAKENKAPLRIGVGVHTGVVAAGMLGGSAFTEYTVLGDTVNVASRIEGLNKQFGSDILVSDATWEKCGAAFTGEKLGEEHVKGRERPVMLYKVLGPRGT